MRRPLAAGLAAAALLGVLAVAAVAVPRLSPGAAHRVAITFPQSASGLVAGSDVMEAGAKVGSVASIEPLPDGHARVVIEVAADHWPLHQGVYAAIRPRSLLGEKYVDVHDGPVTAAVYDATRPLRATESDVPVELDTFLNSLDSGTRAAARTLIDDLGAGVAGTGPDLNQAIAAARANLDNLATTGRTLDQRDPDLDRILVGLDGVLGRITQSDQLTQLQQLIGNGRQTLDEVEAERQAFSRQFADSQAVLGDLNAAVDPAVGSLRDVVALAPHLVDQLQAESSLLAQLGQSFGDPLLANFEQSLLHGPTSSGGALETTRPGTTPLGTALPIFRVCLVLPTPGSCTGSGYTPSAPAQASDQVAGGSELVTLAGFLGA
jgi:phospholipid/cholesterol/gamma-HCH transport system substrate-binding protein